ncbi:DUF882 domain-containing protein [Salinarimonas ramus]|uniref:Murein endopeptidase K n=1 Tax=Salinarimonas ramus TaxID=690164 RepID=A0A917Q5G7_9HYPH|nr:DUF882 domain-containing protein [Salinarimonas ramus]GGK25676.1 hypothetical protein GCM10011322_10270 [Salinarimonas ramus]
MTVQRPSRIRRGLSKGLFATSLSRGFTRGLACLLLATGLTVAGTSGTQDAIANGDTRTLSIRQMHTGERLSVTFKRNGRYDRQALDQLDWILRDWRRDEKRDMDPRLYDALWEVHRQSGSQQPLHVVSGYRSPRTNEMLRSRSSAVAQSSQHIQGRATDFYLPDVPSSRLRTIGMRLQRGGVGFYPRANTPFVHIDVGSVRHWPRMTRGQLASLFPDGRTVHLPSDGRPLSGYDEARRQILAAGGIVGGEQGTAVARGGGERRSLWAALFGGGDEGEAAGDEAYAALPAEVSEIDQRYALFRSAPAAQPAPAPEPAPQPVRAAAPAPAPAPVVAPVAAPPAPVAAPVPPAPVAIAAVAPTLPIPSILPPSRPATVASASPADRTQIAALAEAASADPASPATDTAAAESAAAPTVLAALPTPRPAAFGGAGTVAATPSADTASDGPRLVWNAGPVGTSGADETAAPEAPTVEVALAPLPPPRFDRAPTLVAAAEPAAIQPPATASAFAPVPPARAADAAFAALRGTVPQTAPQTAAPQTAPVATASTPRAPAPPAAVAALPERERTALRALFADRSLAPADARPAAAPVHVASARVAQSGPSGLVAIPAAGVAQGFSRARDGSLPTSGFALGPAVRRIATAP